jgi:hypothetical protein
VDAEQLVVELDDHPLLQTGRKKRICHISNAFSVSILSMVTLGLVGR